MITDNNKRIKDKQTIIIILFNKKNNNKLQWFCKKIQPPTPPAAMRASLHAILGHPRHRHPPAGACGGDFRALLVPSDDHRHHDLPRTHKNTLVMVSQNDKVSINGNNSTYYSPHYSYELLWSYLGATANALHEMQT